MRLILISRKGLHYESAKRGEATVFYVPGQDDPRVYRDLEGKSMAEIAERYGSTGKKPLVRENHGQIEIYGTLNDDVGQRRHALKAYLPQDFCPTGTHAFYYMLGKKHIIHGVRTVTDEGEDRWGNSLITLQGGDPVKIVTSAISERMLDGDAEGICVAVDDNLEVYEGLKESLKPFNIKVTPVSALKPARSITPLYVHKDNSLPMLLLAFLMLLACGAAGFFWWANQTRVDQLNQKIRQVRTEIAQIQSNDKLGHITRPNTLLNIMKQPISRSPSSFIHAGAQTAREFGELRKINIELATQNTDLLNSDATSLFPSEEKIVTLFATVKPEQDMLLVDQEILARSLIQTRPWLRKVENVAGDNQDLKLMLDLKVEANPEVPNE